MIAELRKAGILPQRDLTLELNLNWMLQGPSHIVTCNLAELTGDSMERCFYVNESFIHDTSQQCLSVTLSSLLLAW